MEENSRVKRKNIVAALDKALEYSIYAMIFFAPISITIIETIFIFSAILFVIKKILEPDFKAYKDPMHLLLLVFISFSALSLVNSGEYFTKSLNALVFKWLEYLFIFIIAEDVINTPKRARNAVAALLLSGTLIGLDAVYQKITGFDFLRQRELILGRMTASFKVTNALAAYLVPVLAMVVALLTFSRAKKKYKFVLSCVAALLLTALISTFSRAGWLGLVAALMLFLALSRNIKKASVPLLIFLVVLLAHPSLKDRVTAHGDAQRIKLFSATVAMIKENPIVGNGVGTYMDRFNRYCPDRNPSYAHNSYMQVWAETGIFGFISFTAFLLTLLYKSAAAARMKKDVILLGLICGLFGFIVHAFFDNHFYSVQLSVLFWSLAGICAGSRKYSEVLVT